MANAKVEIAQYPEMIPVKYKKQLPRYIRQKLSQKELITIDEQKKLSHAIRSRTVCRTYLPLCERYEIPVEDLRKGVLCEACGNQMNKTQGRSWTCEVCQMINPAVLEQAITDWFHLMQTTLTNKQLCTYLDINTKSATRTLKKLALKKIGQTKNTYYTKQ